MTAGKGQLKWAAVFFVIAVVSLFVLLLHRCTAPKAKTAQIIQNGEVIRTVDLQSVGEPYEFVVGAPDGGYNIVRVECGKIGIVSADCPDKICVRQGMIAGGAIPVTCLPHKLSVVVSGDGNDVDAVTGG